MKPLFALLLLVPASAGAWTMRDGRSFDAQLAAADGLRATFTRPDQPAVVVPLASLSAPDVETIRDWRKDRRKPLIHPSRIAPWPARASAPRREVRLVEETDGRFVYQSSNFHITSDLRLPLGTVNDIALVFEATRAALIAIPLGFHGGGESTRYRVSLFRDTAAYEKAGGLAGSGGHYDGRRGRMLVLLPNLGITEDNGSLRLEHADKLFILKHEVVHQLMDFWHGRMPKWVDEGIAEFIASLPYSQGHYKLLPPGSGMRDYLLKWQTSRNDRSLLLVPPERLMDMRPLDWDDAVKKQNAYAYYNSAALLAYYFIQQDNGAPLAGFLDAIRRGEPTADAERDHLLHGKSRESLGPEVIALGRKLGVEPTQF